MIDKETKNRAKLTPILEVAESLGLEVGADKKAYCFNGHDSKTKSLSFDVKTNLYKCFGCNCGGDTIALVMSVTKYAFKEAVSFILREEGGQHTPNVFKPPKTPLKRFVSDFKELGEKYSDVYSYFLDLLPFPDENHYLVKDRCLSIKVLKENNIKAIQKEKTWDYVNSLLKVFTEDKLCKSGLLVQNKNNKGYHLFFWQSCAVFPFYKEREICYLQGLTSPELRDRNGKTKNLYSGIKKPSFYFPKSFESFNLKTDTIHITEGVIDVLSALSMQYKSIGIIDIGTKDYKDFDKVKESHIALVGDADAAGFEAKVNIYNHLQTNGFNVQSLSVFILAKRLAKQSNIESIKDINDVLKIITKEGFNETITE